MRVWMLIIQILFLSAIFFIDSLVLSDTEPADFAILDEFRKGLENPELLQWPSEGRDPCGPPLWRHVYCSGSRISQIQVMGLGLVGPLPQDFNKLSELANIGLQRNSFNGRLPSFSGLSKLQYAFLGDNKFDTIPSDFFDGLTSLQVLALDRNPLNKTGWTLPPALEDSAPLANLSLIQCNLVGPIPDFLGRMASLAHLKMSYNTLSGEIPGSFSGLGLQSLWLNNQYGSGLSGPIDAIASMPMLTNAWLHGNSFTGPIPTAIGACTSLMDLQLNNNQLVGLIPENLTTLPQLQMLKLDNNMFMGPIPKASIANFTYDSNSFCQSTPGAPCAPEVTALLDFLSGLHYPSRLAKEWSGNDPCASWPGVACSDAKVSYLQLFNLNLNGSISPSVGKLDNLMGVRLDRNNLVGTIPENLVSLKLLKTLNLSHNNLKPPVPKFGPSVALLTDGNPLLKTSVPPVVPPTNNIPPPNVPPSPPSDAPLPPNNAPSPPSNSLSPPSTNGGGSASGGEANPSKDSRSSNLLIIIIPIIVGVLIILVVILLVYFCCLKRKKTTLAVPSSVVVHPRDMSDPDNVVKVAVTNNGDNSMASSDCRTGGNNGMSEAHVIETGNLVISVQILRSVTQNFAPKNEIGRGGFGVVYKGELHDGTMIAVKRMESTVVSNKAIDEFESEIAVLSKVRHRNLVSLLGYSVEGYERLLVYEYMPQGALSKHLFHWKHLNMEPLSWKRRLNIALDVARGMEYLHSLAHQSFIHRDLKSSNILIGDDFRAKVSDFGLVKLAPDGKYSVATRLAGTFGYLAPEYAVTGKVTTKADVFSFGVVLMELVTGLMALDEDRPEETRYLASWFCHIRSSEEEFRAAIDLSLDVTEETFESISIVAQLAGYCAAREPLQRPDMGHAVNVLAPLVEKWKPMNDDQEEYMGIDLRQPLLQMVKVWKAADGTDLSSHSLDDSKGSIPARPAGFAESFTSADGR